MESKVNLGDNQLKQKIKEMREENPGQKLAIVKWVYDNSDKGLKESKEFVDNN